MRLGRLDCAASLKSQCTSLIVDDYMTRTPRHGNRSAGSSLASSIPGHLSKAEHRPQHHPCVARPRCIGSFCRLSQVSCLALVLRASGKGTLLLPHALHAVRQERGTSWLDRLITSSNHRPRAIASWARPGRANIVSSPSMMCTMEH